MGINKVLCLSIYLSVYLSMAEIAADNRDSQESGTCLDLSLNWIRTASTPVWGVICGRCPLESASQTAPFRRVVTGHLRPYSNENAHSVSSRTQRLRAQQHTGADRCWVWSWTGSSLPPSLSSLLLLVPSISMPTLSLLSLPLVPSLSPPFSSLSLCSLSPPFIPLLPLLQSLPLSFLCFSLLPYLSLLLSLPLPLSFPPYFSLLLPFPPPPLPFILGDRWYCVLWFMGSRWLIS